MDWKHALGLIGIILILFGLNANTIVLPLIKRHRCKKCLCRACTESKKQLCFNCADCGPMGNLITTTCPKAWEPE